MSSYNAYYIVKTVVKMRQEWVDIIVDITNYLVVCTELQRERLADHTVQIFAYQQRLLLDNHEHLYKRTHRYSQQIRRV